VLVIDMVAQAALRTRGRMAEKAVSLKDRWEYRDTLAAAYAEAGRFDDAVAPL